MKKFKLKSAPKIFAPLIVGIMLLMVPLLGDFHIESALFASLVGCFWAGIRACSPSQSRDDFWDALRVGGYLFLVGLPLLANAIITGCFSIHGLAFWLIFPLPSVYFGYAIGRLFRLWGLSYRRLLTIVVLLGVAVGIFLVELLTFPQVYFFNHVWGGWPGPIYDEVVTVDSSAVFFRLLTVLWAVFFWQIPEMGRDRFAKWIVGFAAVAIGLGYMQLSGFGVTSPRPYLQQVLGGTETTEHFQLYYDKQHFSDYEIQRLAQEHEFYYRQIAEKLALPPRDSTNKIESYLYSHPWQKKELVGAKFTSYVPVWLEQDQLHIARQQLESSLQHELVHVMAKQFGNNLFNASWSIGLIEGLAVAIAGGSSKASTVDQIVVSEKPYPTAQQLKSSFSLLGFYSGRSGVNYTTSGSFVQFLMRNYPVSYLKEAYRTGDIAESYPKGWQSLTSEWHTHLDSVRVDSVDRRAAKRIFGIPSLFEQKCPHTVTDFAEQWDSYQLAKAEKDTTQMLAALDRAIVSADSAAPIKAEWSYQHLIAGDYTKVQKAATRRDTTVELQLLFADAFAISGDRERANAYVSRAKELFDQNPDSTLKPALATRTDLEQWRIYRQLTYHHKWPDSTTFDSANYRTKIRSLRKAIERERWRKMKKYGLQLLEEPIQQRYFDDYEELIHHTAFQVEIEMASKFIEKLSRASLRSRHRQRLNQQKEWLLFVSAQYCIPVNQKNS